MGKNRTLWRTERAHPEDEEEARLDWYNNE